jgi:hypothetical protein
MRLPTLTFMILRPLYAPPKTLHLAVYVKKKLYSIDPKLNSTALQAAGIVSKVFEHPFDLTKVRLQAQVLDATARFRGPLDCLVRTFRSEGVRGLYRVCLLSFSRSGRS